MKTIEFSLITLAFEKDEEVAYRDRQLENDLPLLRYLSLLTFFIEVLYCAKDIYWSSDVPSMVVNFRLFYLTPLMLVTFLLTYSQWVKKHSGNMYFLSITVMISLILGQYFMTAMNENPGSSFAKTLPLIFFSTYLFTGIKFKHIIYTTPWLIASYILVIVYFEDIPSSVKINDSILVSMNVLLAVFFKYILEKNRRKGYVRQLIIEEKEQQLEESLKNEKMLSSLRKDLIGILSHDIRGPMNNLQSIIKLLDAKTISSEKGETLLGQVGERIEVITKGVNDLLIWVKSKETGLTIAIETFDAIEFLDEILAIGKTQLEEKNIQIELHIESNLKVVSDKGAVQTIIRNVLSNAIKFSGNDSMIKIEANNMEGEILFSITDQGVGMSPEVIQKVSESFYTTPGTNKETGIGLGLQICFALLEKLDSKLIIDSIKGQGTKMSFSLRNLQN